MTTEQKSSFSSQIGAETLASPERVSKGDKQLSIGIPKERSLQEHRVGLTPSSIRLLSHMGHKVLLEAGAGVDSSFTDLDYTEAGAQLTHDTKGVFQCDVVVKVAPPTPEEIEMMGEGITLISPIHIPTLHREDLEMMMRKRITALAYDFIRDSSGRFPFVRAMSEISGSSVILLAAEFLNNANNGPGILLGGVTGVPPAKVVIIGAGVVGTVATRAALGLGAQVSVFDKDVYRLIDLQDSIGQRVFTSIISPEILSNELQHADVLIGAIHSETGRTPILVSEEMIQSMKTGSVAIDVSIDQGGCFETSEITSHNEPTFEKHGIIHYCVPNIPSRVSQTASKAVSQILSNILLQYADMGGISRLLTFNKGLRQGTYLHNGRVTNEYLASRYQFKYCNLNLLFSAHY